ncbi:condensation domain-containing protein [Pseudomonas sp. NPDC089407]|uniref:condensation domain-containing protein n=1 Tax=Pseudomonas sp. NPDC089407 TaxID=3364464 RepID=UPI00384DE17B
MHLEQRYVGDVLIPQEHLYADHLREAVRFVVKKYPALRGCFTRSEGEWRMDVLAVDAFPVDQALQVVAAAPGVLPGAQAQASVDALLATSTLVPPLLRYILHDADQAEDQRLVLIFHHLVCDGISSRILWRDLSKAYRASMQGCPLDDEACDSYPAFAQELAQCYRALPAEVSPALGAPALVGVLDQAAGEQAGKVLEHTLVRHSLQLEPEAVDELRRCAAEWQVSFSDYLLGCWLQVLSQIQAHGSVALLMWVSPHFVGQWQTPVTELVGSVSFPLPVRLTLQAGRCLRETARSVSVEVEQAMAQAHAFAIRYFSGVAGAPVPDLPAIGFNFISAHKPGGSLIGYRLAPEQLHIARDPRQVADLSLSFEAELYEQRLRLTVLVAPEMARVLPIEALAHRLFEGMRPIAMVEG